MFKLTFRQIKGINKSDVSLETSLKLNDNKCVQIFKKLW